MYNNGYENYNGNQQRSGTAYEEVNYNQQNQSAYSGSGDELYYGNNGMSEQSPYYRQEARQQYANGYQGSSQEEITDSDLGPSSITMQFASNNDYVEEERDNHDIYENYSDNKKEGRSYKICTRGKIIAAVYAIVIAAILSLIVLNTQLLKNMDNQIAQQQAQINALLQNKQELNDTYNYLKSDEVIEYKAEHELGMVHD